jgi:hypothetical protein
MANNQLKMGNHKFYRDKENTYGLPELGKFFLVSHNITLGENASLWPHMKSEAKDIEYLSSRTFNGTILYGNFVLMDTVFWQTDRVQDFVATCLQSGGLHRHRCQTILEHVMLLLLLNRTQHHLGCSYLMCKRVPTTIMFVVL